MGINPVKFELSNIGAIETPKAENPTKKALDSFSNVLNETIENVNNLQQNASTAIEKFVAGEIDIHDVMVETEKAGVALQLTMQLRNKALEAYQEIMRMQV